MNQEPLSMAVQLAGCEYRFACQPSEREELLDAARYLDLKMREIRDHGGNTLNAQAIAVMAALNLSHELLRQQRQWTEAESLVKNQVRDLLQKVDAALSLDTPTSV
ncbi:MAG: cell division protein ZapA [Candidatus Competibacteraceae bacterium]|nr:cell division protein ZapA [Candidatus Competibacteraceae bacterium]